MTLKLEQIIESLKIYNSELDSFNSLMDWIDTINSKTKVNIKKVPLEECDKWMLDEETQTIHNETNSFFSISGIKYSINGIEYGHPIIIQNEIGYLGIACTIINGILYFLMQAKIEPGNVNVVQISPTIQATKSNFTKKHGGKLPAYYDVFENVESNNVIVDQIQSEQGSRFLKKRNRNIIIFVENNINVLPTHRWMTLGQIHALMKIPNLVNMDTRTVLSCFPLTFLRFSPDRLSSAFLKSLMSKPNYRQIVEIYHHLNNCKMKNAIEYTLCNPFLLPTWKYFDGALSCNDAFPFDLIFCDIEIEGREVKKWCQPLFRSKGSALFLLLCKESACGMEFLVSTRQEIGCFDVAELGPTLQMEFKGQSNLTTFEDKVYKLIDDANLIIYDNYLSEEGGRFYHEENRNVILKCNKDMFNNVPEGYFWCSLSTLNRLCQINNVLNIQLRNLLSLVDL